MECDWDFGDLCTEQARLDDHLGGEFHSGAALLQAMIQLLGETAKARVNIMHRRTEPPARENGEHRGTPPAVQKRHRTWENNATPAWQAAALHQIKTFPQLFHEAWHIKKIIAVISIPHDDVFADRKSTRLNSSH